MPRWGYVVVLLWSRWSDHLARLCDREPGRWASSVLHWHGTRHGVTSGPVGVRPEGANQRWDFLAADRRGLQLAASQVGQRGRRRNGAHFCSVRFAMFQCDVSVTGFGPLRPGLRQSRPARSASTSLGAGGCCPRRAFWPANARATPPDTASKDGSACPAPTSRGTAGNAGLPDAMAPFGCGS